MNQENFMLPHDKANHFFYGAMIAVVFGNVAKYLGFPYVSLATVGVATLIAVGKEVVDYYNGKQPDVGDVLLTQLGAVATLLI